MAADDPPLSRDLPPNLLPGADDAAAIVDALDQQVEAEVRALIAQEPAAKPAADAAPKTPEPPD